MKGELIMFWTFLLATVFGFLLMNLGALSVMVAFLALALKGALVVIVLLVGIIIWRWYRNRRITWRRL